MTFDFDSIIDRKGIGSISAECWKDLFDGQPLDTQYTDDEIIPMWVADMAFATPEFLLDAVRNRLDRKFLGYTGFTDSLYYDTFSNWTDILYGWHCEPEDLFLSQGIVAAIYRLAGILCRPGDKVLFQTPAYGPFERETARNGLKQVYNRLVKKDGTWQIDFEDFEKKAADPDVKLFLLCNPHNPTGRMWTEEELRRLGQICIDNGVTIISDEIHCDITRPGIQHIPIAKLFPDCNRIITCMAPSKTFNMAGLQVSNIMIRDPEIRDLWEKTGGEDFNPLSMAAAQEAYDHGWDWIVAMHQYLDGNFAAAKAIFTARLPKAQFRIPEATYLAWVDLSAYVSPDTDVMRLIAEKAGVIIQSGKGFVDNGEGYVRMNLALPRSQLIEALCRICDVLCPEQP